MSKVKRFTKEFKLEAVRLLKEPGMTHRKVAADLGVSAAVITKWVKQLGSEGKRKKDPRDEAVKKLEAENRLLRMERDILKKAMAYFAKEPE